MNFYRSCGVLPAVALAGFPRRTSSSGQNGGLQVYTILSAFFGHIVALDVWTTAFSNFVNLWAGPIGKFFTKCASILKLQFSAWLTECIPRIVEMTVPRISRPVSFAGLNSLRVALVFVLTGKKICKAGFWNCSSSHSLPTIIVTSE